MTRPTTTHDSKNGSGKQDGADSLWYARAVLADATHFDDAAVAEACRLLINAGCRTEPETWFRARDMLVLIEGEAA